MIRFLKEGFRYRLAGVTMLICFVLSMTASYYGITIFKNIIMETKEKNEYQYGSQVWFTLTSENRLIYPHFPEAVKCNLKLLNCELYSDSEDVWMLTSIIIRSDEENIPLVSGRYATEEELETGKPVVILGRRDAEYAYERDGISYYKLQGEEYQVIGITGAKKSVTYDNLILLYKDCLGENARKQLKNTPTGDYDMVIQSNEEDCMELYHSFIENRFTVELKDQTLHFVYISAALPEEGIYCIVIYLFCFICLSVSLKIYVMQRSKEMQVCRACGFSNRKIIGRIIEPMLSVGFISVILFLGTVVLFNKWMGEFAKEYLLGFSWDILLPYVGIFLLAIVLTGALPMYHLLHDSVVQSLNDRR